MFFLLIAAQNKSLKHGLLGLGLLSLAVNSPRRRFLYSANPGCLDSHYISIKNAAWRAPGLAIAVVALAFILIPYS